MISDEMLCIAAGEYEQALLASLPDVDECYHSFSRRFEKKMRHLCHRVKYASTYSVMKRIACAIIAIVLCGSMLLMLNIFFSETATITSGDTHTLTVDLWVNGVAQDRVSISK